MGLRFSVLVFLASLVARAFSQDTSLVNRFAHYKVVPFTITDGLPGNTLLTLNQDLDGYLWLGGFEGLTRFDGNRFVVFDPNSSPELKSSQINVIKLDSKGELWIGTGQGLVKYSDHKFSNLASPEHSLNIESIELDEAHQIAWLGTRNRGLYSYDMQTNRYQLIESLYTHDMITSIVSDRNGGIWVSSDKNGFAHFANNQWQYFSKKDGLNTNEIISLHASNDELYICSILGLHVLKGGKITLVPEPKESRITKVRNGPQGSLWVLTTSGIYIRYKNGTWRTLTRQDGLTATDIRDVVFDRDGAIWLATYRGGLLQLIEEKFVTFSANEGLAVEAVSSVYQLSPGQWIAGTSDGKLFTIENEKAKPFFIRNAISKPICQIMRDRQQNLWFATYDGLLFISKNGEEKLFTERDGLPTRQVRAIIQDKDDNFWIGSRTSGVIKMDFNAAKGKPVFTTLYLDQLSKANATFIISLSSDKSGNLLMATGAGSIIKILKDGSLKQYADPSRPSNEASFAAHEDADGVIWAASTTGILRIAKDSVKSFSRRQGMPFEAVYDIVEDDFGYFWMPSAKGILRVKKNELEENLKDHRKEIHWRVFDTSDDLEKAQCTGASQIFKDASGTFWFPMQEGLVRVNPTEIKTDSIPPKIQIESMTVDDALINVDEEIILPPGSNRFVFSFVSVNLKYQKSIRYKYRVDRFDREWLPAGNQTTAVYTSLPPGNYTFRVTACNKDGSCSSQEAVVLFRVKAYYYQSSWFYLVVLNVLVVSVLAFIRIRTTSIRKRALLLKQMVRERTKELAAQRDELEAINEELRMSQEEVVAQRDSLSEKNNQIEKINATLEDTVSERTAALEARNKKLEEFAFINAHKLRAPLASILGIMNLIRIETDEDSRKKLLELLDISAADLDNVIRATNKMLEEESSRQERSKDGDDR